MAVNKYWPVYVGVFVPLGISILVIVLVVLTQRAKTEAPLPPRPCSDSTECLNTGECVDSRCKCPPQWTGDRCQTIAAPPTVLSASTAACGAQPVTCTSDADCGVCSGTVPFECTELKASQNAAGLEGNYCLPAAPKEECTLDPGRGKYSERVPGVYMWQGWQDVETQQWSCVCEYPSYYPPDTETGACTKSQELCRGGKWHYPCIQTPQGPQCNLTPEQERQLVGSSPLQNGFCECENAPCTENSQCASNKCGADGKCMNQRTGLDPKTNIPICVRNSCAPQGKWVTLPEPPYTFGYCDCAGGSVDTGYGCVPVVPDTRPRCPQNCSYNGRCGQDGKCVCFSGWSGEVCDQTKCDDGCVNRGACIGPNTCTCSPQSVYDESTQTCKRQVLCKPEPAVNPMSGLVINNNRFPTRSQTMCDIGSTAQVDALCKSSACTMPGRCNPDGSETWTGAKLGSVTECYKAINCSSVACDTNYCGPRVTTTTGPISKVASSSGESCGNPSFEEVVQLCSNASGRVFYDGTTASYVCAPFETLQNVQLSNLVAEEGVGIRGIMCISFVDTQTRDAYMAMDAKDVVAYYYLFAGDPREADAVPVPLADSELELRLLPPVSTCTGYYYAFSANFLSNQRASLLSPSDAESQNLMLYITAVPKSKRTCPKPDSVYTCPFDADPAKCSACTPAYVSSVTPVTLLPTTLPQGETRLLQPVLLPCAAYELTQDAGWVKDHFLVAPGVSAHVDAEKLGAVGNRLLAVPCERSSSVVVQAACSRAYCNTGGQLAASKFMVIAWALLGSPDPVMLGGACAFLTPPVQPKYLLLRSMESQGVPVGVTTTLLDTATPPTFITSADATVGYFVDVVPAMDGTTYKYTLNGYMGNSFSTSQCRSPPQTFVVTVNSYSAAFCATLAAPEPGALPPTAWFDEGSKTCYWENNNLAAVDYYCAVTAQGGGKELMYKQLQLSDDTFRCAPLFQQHPRIEKNWNTVSCNPSKPFERMKYACVTKYLKPLHTLDLTQFTQSVPGIVTMTDTGQLIISKPAGVESVSVTFAQPELFPETAELVLDFSVFELSAASGDALSVAVRLFSAVQLVQIFPPKNEVQPFTTADPVTRRWSYLRLERGGTQPILTLSTKNAQSSAKVFIEQIGFDNRFDTKAFKVCDLRPYGTFATHEDCVQKCSGAAQSVPALQASTSCFPKGGNPAYDTSVCKGLQDQEQTRTVVCDYRVPFQGIDDSGKTEGGQGYIANFNAFEKRMSDMRRFHELNAPTVAVTNMDKLADRASIESVYNLYNHCAELRDTRETYGTTTCPDGDTITCPALVTQASACRENNDCRAWSQMNDTEYETVYSQARTCFPSTEYSQPTGVSACCDCRGIYSVFVDPDGIKRGKCVCNAGQEDCGYALKT